MPTKLLYTLDGTTVFSEDISETYNLPDSIPLQTFYYMRITKGEFPFQMPCLQMTEKDQISNFNTHTYI